jgi:adenine-specific DNA-methyltransferase
VGLRGKPWRAKPLPAPHRPPNGPPGWATNPAPKSAELLARYPHLPLHTRHFSADFKARVLACFDDLEAALGGELVHADNYAALRTLEPAYKERVKCIYIDPPYNTGGDGFLYKDDFTRHSSWLSMMRSRLAAGRQLLAGDGVQFTSIDENEHRHLLAAADDVFGQENFITNVIWQKNYSPKNTAQHFSEDHDYITVHAAQAAHWRPGLLDRTDEQDAAYTNPDNDPRGVWSSSDLSARNYYSEGVYALTSPSGRVIVGPPPGTYWRVSKERFEELAADSRIWWGQDGGNTPRLKRFLTDVLQGRVPQTLWMHKEVGHTQDGKRALLSMSQLEAGEALFNTIKPLGLMQRCARIGNAGWFLDYFAGSASSAHAILDMNRTEKTETPARFLLVEQGEYFDTVTLTRIAKVMTAPEWKDGAPKDTVQHADNGDPDHWSRRTLPLVRVLRLERYEDSLNALDFSATGPDGADLLAASADEHLIRYWLQDESQGQPVRMSTERLADPFAYRLTLYEPSGPREVTVDLLETARLLLGLVPRRWRETTDPQGQRHQWLEASRCADVARGVANGVASPAPVLLWLRPVDDERSEVQAKTEYEWLAAQIPQHFAGRQLADFATVLHNRAAFWPAGQRAESIDGLLAQRMLERAR